MFKRRHVLYIILFLIANIPHAPAQVITAVAGYGLTGGYGGDGGPASDTSVRFFRPCGMALDPYGSLYIADQSNNRFRKISPAGILSTFAGTGIAGYSGDGGPATAAKVNTPCGIASDATGNIYITGFFSDIRKIDLGDTITIFAGQPLSASSSGDGGPATAASILSTSGVTADGAGNVYVCDASDRRVRKIDAAGIITTFAGNGTDGYSGDGGPATNAQLCPSFVAADRMGNVYISDVRYYNVRKVDTAGIITTYAGTGILGYSGDGGPATAAQLIEPQGLATDTIGNLFICDFGEARLRRVDTSGIITTIAGNGIGGSSGDGGPATACNIQPFGIALSCHCGEDIYLSDEHNNRIRRIVFNNHPPVFTGGHSQVLSACGDSGAVSIDMLLALADSDAGQPEKWSILSAAHHGAVAGAYAATSTGGIMMPAGFSYTPASGYLGPDTFRIVAIDCGNVPDTTTFFVSIDSFPIAGSISGAGALCAGQSAVFTDTVAGGVWMASNAAASVLSGVVTGLLPGIDTITYAITNGCGTAAAAYAVTVNACPNATATVSGASAEPISIMPNPNSGTFTMILSLPQPEEVRIVITNSIGEVVLQRTVMSNQPNEITLGGPAGIYFVRAAAATGNWSTRTAVK